MEASLDHPSTIADASHILLIQVARSAPGDWQDVPGSPALRHRIVSLSVTVLEVLKGRIAEPAGAEVSLQVTQYDTKSTRITRLSGVWSGLRLDPGAQFVAFCQGEEGSRAADLLVEPACQTILTPDQALADVRLAQDADTKGLDVAALLQEAAPQASRLGHLFADYLWARYGGAILADDAALASALDFLALPDLAYPARATLLLAMYGHWTLRPHHDAAQLHEFIATLFRIISDGNAPALSTNIIQVYLPNLLGLTGGLPNRPAGDVFEGRGSEQDQARDALARYQGVGDTKPLVDWLSQG